jgi:hypothetical protein
MAALCTLYFSLENIGATMGELKNKCRLKSRKISKQKITCILRKQGARVRLWPWVAMPRSCENRNQFSRSAEGGKCLAYRHLATVRLCRRILFNDVNSELFNDTASTADVT